MRYRRAAIERGGRLELPLAVDAYSVAYVIDGAAIIAERQLDANDAVSVTGGTSLSIEATSTVDVLVVSVPAVPGYQPVRRRRCPPARCRGTSRGVGGERRGTA